MKELGARKFCISGRVQGVGYRYFAQRAAHELGVTGYARNLSDGRVEVEAFGSKQQLDDFESRLRQGPVGSDVRGFGVGETWFSKRRGFEIR